MNQINTPIFYGRTKGRPLRVTNQRLMETLWPEVKIDLPDAQLDLTHLFPHTPTKIVLEIGFGGGEHLAHQAALAPDTGYIGCEPFLNGVASLLQHIENNNLQNIRIFKGDARVFLETFPDTSLDHLFLLFPDPWPKARHNKRRFISPENLAKISRVLKPGGILQLATDHADYFDWMVDHMSKCPDFKWLNPDPETWAVEPETWVQTRYQKKALEQGRVGRFLRYQKIG